MAYELHDADDGTLRTEIRANVDDESAWVQADVDLSRPVAYTFRHPSGGTAVCYADGEVLRISTDLDAFRAAREGWEERLRLNL